MRLEFRAAALCSALALAGCNNDGGADLNAEVNQSVAADNMSADGMNGALGANSSMTAEEHSFLNEAMMADNAEVQIGELAREKAASQAAKQFGSMLAMDHGSHKTKLANLLTKAGMNATDEISPDGQADLTKLKGLSGTAFDQAFKQAMVADHQKNIAKYEKQSNSSNPELAALARDTLPVLRKHLATAQSL